MLSYYGIENDPQPRSKIPVKHRSESIVKYTQNHPKPSKTYTISPGEHLKFENPNKNMQKEKVQESQIKKAKEVRRAERREPKTEKHARRLPHQIILEVVEEPTSESEISKAPRHKK